MGNELPAEIQNKIDAAAQQYESATQHEGLGPAIFKDGVNYALAYAKVMADKELQDQAQRMADALGEIINALSGINDTVTNDIVCIAEKALQQFKDGKGKEVVPPKEIEYMPIHPDDAIRFDCPTQFPMHLLSESQAQSNHGQTLKRLKDRGGLSVREILAIVGKKNWSYYGSLPWREAIKMLNDILTNPQK